ncbi:HipA family kinase [Vibrio splendidus]|uniref:HipA family kinase n=1 Tax=Vibrio splendidus TaxID=29497 RepID=UPI002100497A|nr:HipA family kinase [Vibrio splendidus]
MIAIETITRKMAQGRTNPYLCKGDDGKQYVVKGSSATCAGLVKEWIVAHLAKDFGLPIPDFKIAWLDHDLVEFGTFGLEAGYCFASLYMPNLQEITYNQVKGVHNQLLRDLFIFDYWIKNNDRNLTSSGGNPNFFLEQRTRDTCVVDHNLAFADDFKAEEHVTEHVCCDYWEGLALVDREIYTQKFQGALEGIDAIIDKIPDEWLELYSKDTIHREITLVLQQFLDEPFWEDIS